MRHVERGYKLGKWLRRFRERQGMTQTEVARAAGVTPACLSQLENDKRTATAPMLQKLLAAMHVHSLGEFFHAVERGENPVHRLEDRVLLIGGDEPVKAEYIGPRSRSFGFYVMSLELDPGYEKKVADVHPQEECILVCEGKLGIALDGEEYEMNPGEACFIDGNCPHKMRNLCDGLTKLISIDIANPSEVLDIERRRTTVDR